MKMFNRIFGSWKTSLVGIAIIAGCAGLLWFDKITPLQSGIGLVAILFFLFDDDSFKKIFEKFTKK